MDSSRESIHINIFFLFHYKKHLSVVIRSYPQHMFSQKIEKYQYVLVSFLFGNKNICE